MVFYEVYMDLQGTWRYFHQHAEISFQEFETTKEIKRILSGIQGVALLELGLNTGALAVIEGALPGKTILLRSDIDALPIKEQTGLDCPSLKEGVMHACGHDFHIVNLLATANLLARQREKIHGRILLLFQPAEESGGGAKAVIQTGLFERYKVERVLGLHIQPMLESGTIALCDGAISAAVDRFFITIHGKGCHGARPDEGLDPLVAACQLSSGLNQIVSRKVSPHEKAVVSITHIQGGTSWNIIPDEVILEGTNRTFKPEVRLLIKKSFEEQCNALETLGYRVDLQLKWGTPATDNDKNLVQTARNLARDEGVRFMELDSRDMGGEDFAYYQQLVPGMFYHVGVGGSYPLHSSHLEIDLSCLDKSASFMAKLAIRLGR